MTYRGQVKNGTVVLDRPTRLPEGRLVSVRILKKACDASRRPLTPPPITEGLEGLIGTAHGLPADASVNWDSYLYF